MVFCLIFFCSYIILLTLRTVQIHHLFIFLPPLKDKESRRIGSLASIPSLLSHQMAPNGSSVKFNDAGFNYSPQQIGPLVRFSYPAFPLLRSPSQCFHLGLFLFQEQILLLLLFSYQFHFRVFQPL